MGEHTRFCGTALVLWLGISELVMSFPQAFKTTDSTQKCPYTVKLNEINNASTEILMSCCDFTEKLYLNKTYHEVTVILAVNFENDTLNIDYPSLIANGISIKGTNLSMIKININVNYLKVIDMTSNKLETIEKGLLNIFINLKQLKLRNNIIQFIKEDSFIGLTKLEFLDLSENNLKALNNFLAPLKGLQTLNLSKNYIDFINQHSFNNSLLEVLDISHNNLKQIDLAAFQLLLRLFRILISDNPNLGIAHIEKKMLVGSGRLLQQIDASRIGLDRVPEAFTHSVRFLSLVGNEIAAVNCGDFDTYPLLQSLDLTHNQIGIVEDDSLGRLEMLIQLNLSENKLTSVPKSLPGELVYLSINHNLIKHISKADFKSLSKLNILLLQKNIILYIDPYAFEDLLALKLLDLSNNPIQTLSATVFDGPVSLRDLRLCNLNAFLPENDGTFPMSILENLQMLHLQSSPNLARQLLNDSAAVAALSHLKYLDLRMNNLSDIRTDLKVYLGQLKTLRQQGNDFNFSAELWLTDGDNWNASVTKGQLCYNADAFVKEEINSDCSCSFSEMFSFPSDSISAINLNSTKIINKLLKYYDKNKIESEKRLIKIKPIIDRDNNFLPENYNTSKNILSKHWNTFKNNTVIQTSAKRTPLMKQTYNLTKLKIKSYKKETAKTGDNSFYHSGEIENWHCLALVPVYVAIVILVVVVLWLAFQINLRRGVVEEKIEVAYIAGRNIRVADPYTSPFLNEYHSAN